MHSNGILEHEEQSINGNILQLENTIVAEARLTVANWLNDIPTADGLSLKNRKGNTSWVYFTWHLQL